MATLVVALLAARPAMAETSKSFQITAVIANGCSITSIAGSAWGNIALGTVAGVGASGRTASGSLISGSVGGLQIDCTPGMTVGITADAGLQARGGVRQLINGSDATALVPYALYANGSGTAWTTQTVSIAFPVGTARQTVPVTATATLPAAVKGGSYSDTVRITLAW